MTAEEAMAAAIIDASESWLRADLSGECSLAAVAHILAALSAAGFAVVPREPTEAMVEAGCGAAMRYEFHMTDGGTVAMVWAAMIAAAQAPPADTPASGPQTAGLRVKPDF